MNKISCQQKTNSERRNRRGLQQECVTYGSDTRRHDSAGTSRRVSFFFAASFFFLLPLALFNAPAQAAITLVKNIGATATKGVHTQLQVTVPAAGVAAGNTVIIGIALDYASGDAAPSCSDSKGNTYTLDVQHTAGNAYAGAICSAPINTALVSGDTITVTHASKNASAMSANEFSGLLTTGALDKTAQSNGSSDTPDSTATATTTQADELLFGSISSEAPPTTFTAGGSFTALTSAGTSGASTNSNMTVYPEYNIVTSTGAYNATGTTIGTSANWIALIATYKAAAVTTTTLGDGTDPGNSSIAPSGAATNAGAFSFQTSGGTDTITAATVTLAAGTSGGLSLVEIINVAGTTVYGSVTNPASDTPAITLSTNTLTATTTLTEYRIRVTPKSHANMPAPAGSSYAVTARISAWTGTNTQAGSDTAGTTVTIDNLSPGNVTAATATAGDAQVSLAWTNPADADLNSIIVLRRTGGVVADTPVEGTTYVVGNTIGSSTVACVVSDPTASCTDTGRTNGTAYYYKIFTRDDNGNYSASGVVPTGSPATPNPFKPDGMIKLSAEADGSYLTDNTYEATATVQVKTNGVVSGSTAAYTIKFQNDGPSTDSLVITGTGNGSGFTVQYLDDTATDRTAAVIGAGYTISSLAAGASKVWTLNVTPGGSVAGNTSYNVYVTATSSTDGTKTDQVKATTSSTSAVLTLLKSADKANVNPGEEISYTVTASNGAGLTAASNVVMTDPIPANTGFKIAGATFNAGTSTLTNALSYSDDGGSTWTYMPASGGCSAPAGYDYCVNKVKWTTSGSMPTGTSFNIGLVVVVK